jgi:energy-converting hydrogenase Eha subunit G
MSKPQGLVRLEGLANWENSFTSWFLEPATFRLVEILSTHVIYTAADEMGTVDVFMKYEVRSSAS